MELTQEHLQKLSGPLFNAVTLCGIAVSEPEDVSETDVPAVTFLLAVPKVWKNKGSGQTEHKPLTIIVRAWGDLAELARSKIAEGCGVLVQGRLEQHVTRDAAGHEQIEHYVGARYLQWWEADIQEVNHGQELD
jgi:single-stranded DNA-binding protein